MSTVINCLICHQGIYGTIDRIIAECGHSFHASCLLENIPYNGYECPCCREEEDEECDCGESNVNNEEELIPSEKFYSR